VIFVPVLHAFGEHKRFAKLKKGRKDKGAARRSSTVYQQAVRQSTSSHRSFCNVPGEGSMQLSMDGSEEIETGQSFSTFSGAG
jgi:hypothetical protein